MHVFPFYFSRVSPPLDLNGIPLLAKGSLSIKMRCATYAHHLSGGNGKNGDNKEILCTKHNFQMKNKREKKHFRKIATAEAVQLAD